MQWVDLNPCHSQMFFTPSESERSPEGKRENADKKVSGNLTEDIKKYISVIFPEEVDDSVFHCIARYTPPHSLSDKIKYIAYRIWNAIKAIFGASDWQIARRHLKENLLPENLKQMAEFFKELQKAAKSPEIKKNFDKKDVDAFTENVDKLFKKLDSTFKSVPDEYLECSVRINQYLLECKRKNEFLGKNSKFEKYVNSREDELNKKMIKLNMPGFDNLISCLKNTPLVSRKGTLWDIRTSVVNLAAEKLKEELKEELEKNAKEEVTTTASSRKVKHCEDYSGEDSFVKK